MTKIPLSFAIFVFSLVCVGAHELNKDGKALDEHIKEVADMGGIGAELFDFQEGEFEGLSDEEKVIKLRLTIQKFSIIYFEYNILGT